MSSTHGNPDLDLALEAARAAGTSIMRVFGNKHEVTYKSPGQPVTAADLEADRILHEVLLSARPDYGWLSEETVDHPDRLDCDRVWIVDPIDGTRTFIKGKPEFSISIALAHHGAVVLGVVANPATGETFWAVRGSGAYLDDARLKVSERATADGATIVASSNELRVGEFSPFRDGWTIQPVGSTAYKLARVAQGAAEAFLSRGSKSEWDVAAGDLIVQEAGGRVTDLRRQPLRYNQPDPYVHGILATNGRLHEHILAMVDAMPSARRLRD
ncbi:MAG: 3'(2'),5'-bisphosphate nucleotidase CysQ [Gemmatimonadota bacterium]